MDPSKNQSKLYMGQKPYNYKEPETIAQVTVTVYGLEKGNSQVQVYISPKGALADGASLGEKRSEAYNQLLTIIERELKEALDILGQE